MWWKAKRITPLDDHSAASWIQQGLLPLQRHEKGYRVGNVVPQGFEAYARVFHPASRYIADRQEWVPARWSGIASWTGRTAHPAMQFHSILGHPENPAIKPEWGSLPIEGSLDSDQIGGVIDVLTRFTTTPDVCFFCIWEGWGEFGGPESFAYLSPTGTGGRLQEGSEDDLLRRLKRAKRLEIGLFGYILSTGPMDAFLEVGGSPSLWWPQDRAWCVASDVDLTSTFVGGTEECIAHLVGHLDLEALPIGLDVRIDVEGDTINT